MKPVLNHLYVHVPFCPTLCPYCDFHVLHRQSDHVDRYLKQLETEAQHFARHYDFDLQTVYIGGGTPSFLRDREISQMVETIQTHLGWGKLENTLEVNPGTVSAPRVRLWHELGFDRASVGVQSLNDDVLKFLGRSHRSHAALEALQLLLETGFRVSGDLITAVPHQDIAADIEALVNSGVEHISAYTLTIEPGTEFARRGVQVSEADEHRGFFEASELLAEKGFSRYEVSNYAKTQSAQSIHNLAYWNNRFYLGLGPSAAGHLPGRTEGESAVRYTQPHLASWLTGEQAPLESINAEDHVTDALFMGLRLTQGLCLQHLSETAGFDVAQKYAQVIEHYQNQHLLELKGHRLRVPPKGLWILNRILTDFLELKTPSLHKPT